MGGTLIDGSGAPPRRDAVILVRNGHIAAVGARGAVRIPRKTPRINLAGRWIIPGLVDAHAHVARWALPRYLAWGVTTVRDVHGTLDSILALRQDVNRALVAGPRIYSAGAMIDGLPTTYPDAIGVASPVEARRAVDRLVRAGVDLVKVYTRVTPGLLRPLVDEATAFRLEVTGHLGLTDALTAARLGLGSIEHMSGVPEATSPRLRATLEARHRRGFFPGWTAFERSWAGLDSATLDRVARGLAARRVILVPTLILHDIFSRLDDPEVTADPALRAVPHEQQERWNVPGMIRRAGWTPADFEAFRRARPRHDLFLRAFRRAGGRIAAGTDAANQLLVPGYSEHQELELLVVAGLSPAEALRAGTVNGAVLLQADSIGRIAPGKVADLVVLTRDPIRDVRNTRSVEAVMARGRFMRADSIRAAW